jgi:hypothetical protein
MSKYEVWVTRWSEEHNKQVKVIAGEFDKFINAKLFAKAYAEHYSATAEIVEYAKTVSCEIAPNQ